MKLVPEGQHDAEDDGELIGRDEQASHFRRSKFGIVQRSETLISDQPADSNVVHLPNGTEGPNAEARDKPERREQEK